MADEKNVIEPIPPINSNPPEGEKSETPPSLPQPISPPPRVPVQPEPPKGPSFEPDLPKTQPAKSSIIKRGSNKLVKTILYSLLFLVVAALVFFIFFYRVTIKINPSPTPDKILIDGQEFKGGIAKIMPGFHSVEVKKDGYVSFIENKNFKVGEIINLNFQFVKAASAELVSAGGSLSSSSYDNKFVNFVDLNGILSVVPKDKKKGGYAVSSLSNGNYKDIRKLLFSNEDKFAVLLDQEAIKVVDFSKSDLINQIEAKLPPMASAIHSITWNTQKSKYFPEVNQKILYDLDVDYGWNLIAANSDHSQSEIIMKIDKKDFKSLQLDWMDSPKDVLMVGGQVAILDLSNRSFQTISKEADFVMGKWGPKGYAAVLVDAESNLYILKDKKVTKTDFKANKDTVTFITNNNILLGLGDRPIRYNFDTNETINYAEIEGFKDATSVTAFEGHVFFTDKEGLKSASLAEKKYVE